MDFINQYPEIGALIFILVTIVPIAVAVYKNKKTDDIQPKNNPCEHDYIKHNNPFIPMETCSKCDDTKEATF